MSLYGELKRRSVLRVGAAYAVTSWLLIQVAETVFPLFGFDDTPARIVVIVLSIGFVPAIIFSWVFELTPEGIKRDKETDHSQTTTPGSGKKLDRMIIVVLVLAVSYFAFDKFIVGPQREAASREQQTEQLAEAAARAHQEGRTSAFVDSFDDRSIAVLAFDDMSPKGDQEYLSDGISEELLNLLAKIPELRVISRSSAFSYKGKSIKIARVAEELGVAHILEGSVRKAGNRVRITAQLIDARSDTHLWSESYDRTLDDIFAIQDEIAAIVVEQLKINLLAETPRVRVTDPEAYALALQARHLGALGTPENWEKSNDLWRQVLAFDPEYVVAWAGLASNYVRLVNYGPLPASEGYASARQAAEKAVAIDPHYGSAYARLGWISMLQDADFTSAARYFERALELDSTDTEIINGAGVLLHNLGRLDEAIPLFEYVTIRDPVTAIFHSNLGSCYRKAGRLEDAVASYQAALRLSPSIVGVHYNLSRTLLFKGEAEAALEVIQKEPRESFRLLGLVMVWHDLDNPDASDSALNEFIEKFGSPYSVAYILAYRNEADRAFEWLNAAYEAGGSLDEIAVQPEFGPIREDPRWLPFLSSIGKAPAQLNSVEFNISLP